MGQRYGRHAIVCCFGAVSSSSVASLGLRLCAEEGDEQLPEAAEVLAQYTRERICQTSTFPSVSPSWNQRNLSKSESGSARSVRDGGFNCLVCKGWTLQLPGL